jgi:hypothetical protein
MGQTSQKIGHVHPGTDPDDGTIAAGTGNTSRNEKAPGARRDRGKGGRVSRDKKALGSAEGSMKRKWAQKCP